MSYVARVNPARRRVEVIHSISGEFFALRLEDPRFDEAALDELGFDAVWDLTLEAVASCLTAGSDAHWDAVRESRKRPFEL